MHFCSEFSRRQGEDPAGTAPFAQHHIIVEIPLPWPADVFTAPAVPPGLAEVFRQARAAGVTLRTNAMAPDPEYSRSGWTRVFHFRQPAPPLQAYMKEEYLVPTEQTAGLAAALLAPATTHAQGSGAPREAAAFHRYRQNTDHIRELMVCTHDERDACCGRFGASLYEMLRREAAPAPATGAAKGAGNGTNKAVRVWRVSHMGGHRLAPTLMDMPEGRYWGHLTPDAARQLLHRTGPVENLRRHYRGWALLGDPLLQVAEREAFIHYGWPWRRRAVTGTGVDGSTVSLAFTGPGPNDRGTLQAGVEELPPVPTITCSDPEPKGRARQFRVTQVQVQDGATGRRPTDLSAPAG
ncbi:MAG TPA: sucrase ferredoxin [Sphingobacteriaceae bacterium]|nr:sucrase ferredoxin [Sphingobacteriaceae bacterium]